MLYEILHLLLSVVAGVLGSALLLRAYMQRLRVDPHHPLVQFVMQLTNRVVLPLRRAIPPWGGIDWASLLGAWLVALVMWLILYLTSGISTLGYIVPILLHALFTVLEWALYLMQFLILIYIVISWVAPDSHHAPLLSDLVSPWLRPIRRLLPRVQQFDFSPLVLLILVQIGFILLRHLKAL